MDMPNYRKAVADLILLEKRNLKDWRHNQKSGMYFWNCVHTFLLHVC